MPRYVIDADNPIGTCWQCPWCETGDQLAYCVIKRNISYPRGRSHSIDDARRSRPSWCPLQSMEDINRQDMMNMLTHDVFLVGHGTYRFETIECPRCKNCRTIDADHVSLFCPSCGSALDADAIRVVKHHTWALYPSQSKQAGK